ncbi:MAG: hypothetical protein LCH96_16935 [Actinobacteria bacterium]|nr:hypothetical protein [Actinomycetota bacterium]
MSRSSTTTGRIVWVYVTRGCGTVTPEEYRQLWQLREQQLDRTLEAEDIPWDLEIIGEYALEVSTDTEDDYYSSDLGDPARWGYCRCGDRGGNAELNVDGGLEFECQRCAEVFADPYDDQRLYR